jgi:NAD(P)-dependent dehydrogenase (short-subunit alcohol dehydrogenase family)
MSAPSCPRPAKRLRDSITFPITPNAIAPAPIDTEMVRGGMEQGSARGARNQLPLRRLGRTEEIARRPAPGLAGARWFRCARQK